jgi:hypothetical protein
MKHKQKNILNLKVPTLCPIKGLTKSCRQQWQQNSNYSIGERVLRATKSDLAIAALHRTENLNGTCGLKMQKLQYHL